MYCPKCGKELKEGAKFCTNCSYAVPGTSQVDVPINRSKGKAKWPIIIVAAILLMLIILVSLVAVPGVNRMRYQSFLKTGNRYLTEMNYDEAVVSFTKAIQIEAKEAAGYYGRGNAYFGLAGQAETEDDMWSYSLQAEEDYYVVLDLDEMMTDAYEALSEVYLAWDEWDEALDILEFGYEVTGESKLSEKAETVRELLTAGNDESEAGSSTEDTTEENFDVYEDSIVGKNTIIPAMESGNIMAYIQKSYDEENYLYFFNSEIDKRAILTVTFLNNLDMMPTDAWDVSANQDGSVWAWVIINENGPDRKMTMYDGDFYDLYIAGIGGVDANPDCSSLFLGYESVQEFNFNHCFYTGNVTDMSSMFERCGSLNKLDLRSFDTSNVTDMSYMLSIYGEDYKEKGDFSLLHELDVSSFDTSRVTDMSGMFYFCTSLEELDISNFDTSKVTDMKCMFERCSSLKQLNLTNFDTSQVTDMSRMFWACSRLSDLDVSKFDTSQVVDMGGMFSSIRMEHLDLGNFDTSCVTNMSGMFLFCRTLLDLNVSNFDTSHVTNMSSMFRGCSGLQILDVGNFNTSQVKSMNNMFGDCSSLLELDISGFDMTNVTDDSYMFRGTRWETE